MYGHETAIHKPVLTDWLDSEQCFSDLVHFTLLHRQDACKA